MKTSNLTKDFEKRQNFDFEIWRFENRNTFRADNILNTTHFWLIVAALKCARLILQFHRFIDVCAKWKTVIENAMKIDVFEFLRLMFRSGKNFLIRKNGLFFIESILFVHVFIFNFFFNLLIWISIVYKLSRHLIFFYIIDNLNSINNIEIQFFFSSSLTFDSWIILKKKSFDICIDQSKFAFEFVIRSISTKCLHKNKKKMIETKIINDESIISNWY